MRLPHDNDVAIKYEKEIERSQKGERKKTLQGVDPKRLTKTGSDPQASESGLVEKDKNPNLEFDNLVKFALKDEVTGSKVWWNPQEGPGTIRTNEEGGKSIKEPEATYQGRLSPSPPLKPINIFTPPNSPNCSPRMNPIRPPDRNSRPLHALATACEAGPEVPQDQRLVFYPVPNVQALAIGPCPPQRHPGIIAASHLTPITPKGLPPPDPSFFGYSSTIVVEDSDGVTHTYHGNVLVHLFTRPSPNFVNTPPLPPRGRPEAWRRELIRSIPILRHSTGMHPGGPGNPESLRDRFRNDPQTNETHPLTGGGTTRDTEDPQRKEKCVGRDVEAAEILVSLQKANACKEVNLPVPGRTFTQPQEADKPADRTADRIQQQADEPTPESVLHNVPSKPSTDPTSKNENGAECSVSKQTKLAPDDTNEPMVSDVRPKNEPVDVDMVVEDTSDSPQGSPPGLSYPEVDTGRESPVKRILDKDPEGNSTAAEKSVEGGSADLQSMDDVPSLKNLHKQRLPGVCVSYLEWKVEMGEVKKHLAAGKGWFGIEVRQIFERLGMLQWWFALRFEQSKGDGKVDWETWKKDMVEEWKRRFPDCLPTIFKWMAEDIEKLDGMVKEVHVLAIKRETDEREEDIDMDESDVPDGPTPSPISTKASIPLPEPNEESPDEPPLKNALEISAMEVLTKRVVELEEQVRTTTKEIQEKIADIEDQVIEDNSDLANLRWRTKELEELTKKEGRSERKGGRKGRAKPDHEHLTRYAKAVGEEPVQLNKRELGSIEKSIRIIKEGIERQGEEIGQLRGELAKVEALEPRLTELSASFDKLRAEHGQDNEARLDDFTWLRARVHNEVTPRLGHHEREIAILHHRYLAIFEAAAKVLAQSPNGRATPKARMPLFNFPSPTAAKNIPVIFHPYLGARFGSSSTTNDRTQPFLPHSKTAAV